MKEDSIISGTRRFVWWDGALWWRTYKPGGFDGYRTVRRKLTCDTLAMLMRQTRNRKEES